MDNIIDYLLDYASSHSIGYKLTHDLPSSIPSCAFPETHEVLINMEWHNHEELPFQIAHELGHVINGDTGIRYYESFPTRSTSEYKANVVGIQLLLRYCKDNQIVVNNPIDFCERFGVPAHLETTVAYQIQHFNN